MFYSRFAPLRTGVLCACLLPLGLLTGCGGGSSSSATITPVNTGPVTSTPRTNNGLQYTLASDKSVYKVGEVVNLTFTLANVGSQSVSEIVGQPNVLVAVSQGTQVVWQTPNITSGGGAGFAVGSTGLASGAALTYQASWPQTATSSGKQVAVGQYTITATLNDEASSAHQPTNPIQIAVAP